MSSEQYFRLLPKAELHVHLEGAIQPATLLELAQRNKITLPVQTVEEMQQWFAYRDFNHFVEIYVAATGCLKTAEDYEQIVYEFGANMAQQNIHYAEVTFSPATNHLLGIPHDVYFSGLTRGRERARTDFNVQINWIFDIVRQWKTQAYTRPMADYTTSVAIEGKNDGVVALGLAGAEAGAPPEPFAPWFEQARAAGLHSIPHAGEHAGPASIWGAIHALGAERIGHGVRAIEDPELVTYLAEHHIPLEISPTSNIRLGVYPTLPEHPLPQLYAAGVPVTINSDDPPLFNTTLTHEVELLETAFHLPEEAIDDILLNGVRYSFLPAEQKAALEQQFHSEIKALHDNS